MNREFLDYVEDILDAMQNVPWREMAGMRDKIIHGYDNVNLRLVWETVQERIPEVRPLIQQILADYRA